MQVLRYVVLCLFVCLTPLRGVAAPDVEASRIAVLELIAGQSILVNRIGKSVCYLLLGADRGLLEKEALAAIEALNKGFAALAESGPSQQGVADMPAALKVHLADIRTQARALTLSAQQIIAGDLHNVPIGLLLNRSAQLDGELTHLGLDLSHGGQSGAILAVQHQMALVEGMLRDVCLMQVNLLGVDEMAEMPNRVNQFEKDMAALLAGDAQRGIQAPATVSQRVTLQKIQKFWVKLKPTVEAAIAGDQIDLKRLQKASIFAVLIGKSVGKTLDYYRAG